MNKSDRRLISVLALICLVGIIVTVCWPRSSAGMAIVAAAGKTVATLPLDQDCDYVWESGTNRMEISVCQGAVSVKQSTCSNQNCVRQGTISASGQIIACLPNQVTITLTGTGEDVPDAILR